LSSNVGLPLIESRSLGVTIDFSGESGSIPSGSRSLGCTVGTNRERTGQSLSNNVDMVVSGSRGNIHNHSFTNVRDRVLEGELEVSTGGKSTDVSALESVITWSSEATMNT
jgi:hypothetical protein